MKNPILENRSNAEPAWDAAKLDEFLAETTDGFWGCLREDERYNRQHPCAEGEERDTHSQQGYFMHRLLACKPGARLVKPEPTIEGPLFADIS